MAIASRAKSIAFRVKDDITNDNLGVISAGVAFYALLALFPALAAAISIYGLFADPQTVAQQIDALAGMLPQGIQGIIRQQLGRLAGASQGALSVGVVIGILAALWSATKGVTAIIKALNIVFDVGETRGFFKLIGVSLALTTGVILVGLATLVLVAVLPPLIGALNLGSAVDWAVSLLRWPILLAVGIWLIGMLYRYGPNRPDAGFRWWTPGSVVAVALWLLGSIAFSVYVANFASYNKTYGTLGTVIVLMMWLFVSAYAVLIGAEVNAELEGVKDHPKNR